MVPKVVWDETEKRTAHGPLRADPTVLQVAVARLSGYRWPAEQDAGMELADEQREWVRRCETLHAFADEDGIVCIPPVRGEPSAAERIQQLLAAAFGNAWNDGVLTRLLAGAGAPSLDDWLRNRFFEQHCKLSTTAPSSGTSGTAASATASMRWSTTTSWPRAGARAADASKPSPTATSATGSSASRTG